MSFIDDIFAPKPGGTFVGNLLRSAASGATGGILGQGKNMINADGTKGNGSTTSVFSDILASIGYVAGQTPQGQKVIQESTGTYVQATAKTNWLWIAIIGVLGVLLIMKGRK